MLFDVDDEPKNDHVVAAVVVPEDVIMARERNDLLLYFHFVWYVWMHLYLLIKMIMNSIREEILCHLHDEIL